MRHPAIQPDKPIIGVTGPDRGGWPAWLFTSWAVRRAGGRPLRVRPSSGLPRARLDGLIVGGGADVHPQRYSGDRDLEATQTAAALERATSRGRAAAGVVLAPVIHVLRRMASARPGVDPARDALELRLLQRADLLNIPVLGICRGAQLMNVHAGGSLHRSLETFYTETTNPWTVFPRKPIEVAAGSFLEQMLGRRRCRVNSLHRQAVRDLGDDFEPVALEGNGVVQAIERRSSPLRLGVQWHPELMPQRADQQRIFDFLVDQARRPRTTARSVTADVCGVWHDASVKDASITTDVGTGIAV